MKTVLIGSIAALITGFAIGIQSTLASRAGSIIGSLKTGLLTNVFGGTFAGIVVLILILYGGTIPWKIPTEPLIMISSAGIIGVFIVTGVSFSLQRTGIAAGLATIIVGQMIVSIVIDTKGIGGAEPIELSFQRIIGILLMGVSVFLLMPKR